jgi:GDP-mannose 6-dehydrogenase
MNVAVFGLGYVGSLTAACLASLGHHVFGVDVNPDKVELIRSRRSPIREPGLDELIKGAVNAGRLAATCDAEEAVLGSDVLLVCVGTPPTANGSADLSYVDRVCSEIARAIHHAKGHRLVAMRSTVLPGTISSRIAPLMNSVSGRQAGADFDLAVNPEFLREGSGVQDFQNPPFTLVGEYGGRGGDVLEELYRDIPAEVVRTDPDTACMVKLASNAYHGLKVAFANEIGRISKAAGVDGTEVMRIFCKDNNLNISTRYLRPGFAFGGSCLPKDLRALIYDARHSDVEVPVLDAILPSNHLQIQCVVERILQSGKRNVGILGLSFKEGTDDLRESPMVELVEALVGKGLDVRIHDQGIQVSELIGTNRAYIERALPHIARMMCRSREEVIRSSNVVVLAHDTDGDRLGLLGLLEEDQMLIDLVKIGRDDGPWRFRYEGICW